ncbi:hypothetical protein BH11CYA1_BH11CYA1_06660 [soil metagenome]
MQTLISLFLSACLSAALYQFIAPRFSRGAVAFQPVSLGYKLLFGVALSTVSQVVLMGLTLLASVTLVPLLAIFGAATSSATPTAAVLALSVVLLVTLLQLANWVATMTLGRLMPTIIRVDSASAAFKAALAPTLVTGVLYVVMVFALAPMMAVPS